MLTIPTDFTTEGCAMSWSTLRWTTLVMLLSVGLSGCGYFQSSSAEDDAELADIDELDKADPIERLKSERSAKSEPLEGELELKLKVGERFPLTKTVEHRLTQTDRTGSSISTSRTHVMLSLIVDELQPDGRKQLAVRYHRVQYEQDIRGKRIEYSSDRPAEAVPPEALLYAGLANNGFSFWIGPDNKIIELVGFNDFLQRCLRNVPTQYKNSVQQQLEATRSEDGIANFIDDSIGLLPYSSDPSHPAVAVKEGSIWELKPKHSERPIPMLVTTRCTLKELTKNSADIVLTGRISGSPNAVLLRSPEGDIKVRVTGGRCTGECRVDRNSGLPTQSQVQRLLEMEIEMADGQRIQQNKETLSSMTSFLDQSTLQSEASSRSPVQQAGVQAAVGSENHRRVVPAVGTRAN